MKKRLLTLPLLFTLLACETNPPLADDPSALGVTPLKKEIISVWQDPKNSPAGNLFYIYVPKNYASSPSVSSKQIEDFLPRVKAALEAKGFKLTNQSRKAHLIVAVGVTIYIPTSLNLDDFGVSTSRANVNTKITQNGVVVHESEAGVIKKQLDQFFVAIDLQYYSKRPSPRIIVSTVLDQEVGRQQIGWINDFEAELKKVSLFPPEKPLPMKGDPGCLPLFGFDTQPVNDSEGRKVFAINHIAPKSAASQAGLLVGDIVVAIDSQPYVQNNKVDRNVYETFQPVPIKLERQGKTLRKTITAKLVCDNNY